MEIKRIGNRFKEGEGELTQDEIDALLTGVDKDINIRMDRIIVVTSYGHDRIIDKIAISIFNNLSTADFYCQNINHFYPKKHSWMFAQRIERKESYFLSNFVPLFFEETIMELEPRAIQKVLRETDRQEFSKALKGASDRVKEKIFNNMSKRSSQYMKEIEEYMGPVRQIDIEEAQKKILEVVHDLENRGEIVVLHYTGNGELIE